jgi:hypothetical protein
MIQKLVDLIYRTPRSKLRLYNRFGGYFNYRRMLGAQAEMERSANDLPPVLSYPDGLEITFLTGRKFLYQTLFCIRSLSLVSKERYLFTLVDDGSFDEQLLQTVNLKLPGCRVVLANDISTTLERVLPPAQFPNLHRKRSEYPHIKKLTDVHTLAGSQWKVVIDSDMLFWDNPKAFNNWLRNPQNPLYMVDCEESYGYSQEIMVRLTGESVPRLLNVGIIGLKSSFINWTNIEQWIGEMEQLEGKSYYLEQALSAMIIGSKASTVLSQEDYIVNPSPTVIESRSGALHHYVDLSKEGYYKKAWRNLR